MGQELHTKNRIFFSSIHQSHCQDYQRTIYELLKFAEVRKWCVDNLDNDSGVLMRRIYDSLYEVLVPTTIPAAVLIIAKYQYQIAFVADQEINLLACLTEIMVECEFK